MRSNQFARHDGRYFNLSAIAYWLIPARPVRELLSEIIRILAEELDAPRFEPHLTLFVAPGHDHTARKLLRGIEMQRIHLAVRDVGFSDKFAETLFVRFEASAALKDLRRQLRQATKSRGELLPDPHVSLIYKELAPRAKSELASAIKFPFHGVVFDCIKAIRCRTPTRSRADVEAWKVVARKSLRS